MSRCSSGTQTEENFILDMSRCSSGTQTEENFILDVSSNMSRCSSGTQTEENFILDLENREQIRKLKNVLDSERRERDEERREWDEERVAHMLLKQYTSLFTNEVQTFTSLKIPEMLNTVVDLLDEARDMMSKYENSHPLQRLDKKMRDIKAELFVQELERVRCENERIQKALEEENMKLSEIKRMEELGYRRIYDDSEEIKKQKKFLESEISELTRREHYLESRIKNIRFEQETQLKIDGIQLLGTIRMVETERIKFEVVKKEWEEYKEQQEKKTRALEKELERAQARYSYNENNIKDPRILLPKLRNDLEKNENGKKTMELNLRRTVPELERYLFNTHNAEPLKRNLLEHERVNEWRARDDKIIKMSEELKKVENTLMKELEQALLEKIKLEDVIGSLERDSAETLRQKKELEKEKKVMEKREEEWKRTEEQSIRRIHDLEKLLQETAHSVLKYNNQVITLQAQIVLLEKKSAEAESFSETASHPRTAQERADVKRAAWESVVSGEFGDSSEILLTESSEENASVEMKEAAELFLD